MFTRYPWSVEMFAVSAVAVLIVIAGVMIYDAYING